MKEDVVKNENTTQEKAEYLKKLTASGNKIKAHFTVRLISTLLIGIICTKQAASIRESCVDLISDPFFNLVHFGK